MDKFPTLSQMRRAVDQHRQVTAALRAGARLLAATDPAYLALVAKRKRDVVTTTRRLDEALAAYEERDRLADDEPVGPAPGTVVRRRDVPRLFRTKPRGPHLQPTT